MAKRILSLFIVVATALSIMSTSVFATNNSISTARSISFGTTVNGQVSINNRADFYSFELRNSGRISISITSFMQFYCIVLYNGEGQEIWKTDYNEWISTTGQRSDTHQIDLERGTYYFQVNGYRFGTSQASTGNYNFIVTFNSSEASTPNPNNNNIATAQRIAFNSNVRGQIAINDRADFYSFELLNSGRITINITSFMQFYCILIYNSEGHEVWRTDYNEWISTTGQRIDTHNIDLEKGTYFFQVNGYRFGTSQASTGNYDFTATFNSSEANTPNPNNNNIATAHRITFSTNVKGQIAINDRADFYSFELSNSGRISISITSFMQFYSIILYNSEGREIWKTDYNEWISTTGQRNDTHRIDLGRGVYYIQVNGYRFGTSQASTRNYNFTISDSVLGDITGSGRVEIGDALEILKYLAKLPSLVNPSNVSAWNAARIVTPGVGNPTISDVLEILKKLAKLPNLIDGK
jgi:chitinase